MIDLLKVIILYGELIFIVFYIKHHLNIVSQPFIKIMYNLCLYCIIIFFPIMLYEGHHYFERVYPFGISSFHLFFFIINLIWMYFAGHYIYLPELTRVDDNHDVSHFSQAYELSKRESEIVLLLLEGKSYIQIASELFISPETVKTHLKKIYRKSGVSNKMELSQRIKKYNLP
ncbi:MAG: helix-turn-helix transcriptional regulator [Candidatus Delongbacteria bacterium]|nr:helix-turn-helix transcriptional regulator [Candidatus Delongbacteria bacterium]